MSFSFGLLNTNNRFHHADQLIFFLFSTLPSINANSDFKVHESVRHIPLVSQSKPLPETQRCVICFSFPFLSAFLSFFFMFSVFLLFFKIFCKVQRQFREQQLAKEINSRVLPELDDYK